MNESEIRSPRSVNPTESSRGIQTKRLVEPLENQGRLGHSDRQRVFDDRAGHTDDLAWEARS